MQKYVAPIHTWKSRKIFPRNPTFAAKFLLSLAGNVIDPMLACVLILKFHPDNRTRTELEKLIPYVRQLKVFNKYLSFKEKREDYEKILVILTRVLIGITTNKNYILKRVGENNNMFYLIFYGKIGGFGLIFSKYCLSTEEYLLHLIKLTYLNEHNLVKKIIKINQDIFPIKNLENFLNENESKYNINILKQIAIKVVKENGFEVNQKPKKVLSSIKNYLEATTLKNEFIPNDKLRKETKKFYIIPQYQLLRVYETGEFIGNLNSLSNCAEDYTLICLENCEICYINKDDSSLKNDNKKISNFINGKLKKICSESNEGFYIFKTIPPNYFNDNYSKLVSYKVFDKGEKLFVQDSLYNGIYLILKGEVEITTKRTFEELDSLLLSLQSSLENFTDCYSTLKNTKLPLEDITNNLRNPIYLTKQYVSSSRKKKLIKLFSMIDNDVCGLNELYNNKTNVYEFTAECVSDKTFMLFISKNNFNYIYNKENDVKKRIVQLVELRVKYLISAIERYKSDFFKILKEEMKENANDSPKINYENNANINHHIDIINSPKHLNNYKDKGCINFEGKYKKIMNEKLRIDDLKKQFIQSYKNNENILPQIETEQNIIYNPIPHFNPSSGKIYLKNKKYSNPNAHIRYSNSSNNSFLEGKKEDDLFNLNKYKSIDINNNFIVNNINCFKNTIFNRINKGFLKENKQTDNMSLKNSFNFLPLFDKNNNKLSFSYDKNCFLLPKIEYKSSIIENYKSKNINDKKMPFKNY